eukprot:1211189-Pyramimonas_sp.AAC.2
MSSWKGGEGASEGGTVWWKLKHEPVIPSSYMTGRTLDPRTVQQQARTEQEQTQIERKHGSGHL